MTSLIFWKKKFKIRSRGGDIERFHVFFRIALQRHQVVASIQFLHCPIEWIMLYRSVYESQLYDSPVMSNHIDPVRIFSYNFSTYHLRSATYDSKNKSGVHFSTLSTILAIQIEKCFFLATLRSILPICRPSKNL